MQPPNVLIVDDEPEMCSLIRDRLAPRGFRCVTATVPHQAKRLLDSERFSVVVADIVMPEVSGLDLLAYARQSSPAPKVILITGIPETQYLADAIRFGAYDYFQKPLDMGQLLEAVSQAAADDPAGGRLPVRAAQAMQANTRAKQASLETIRALVHTVEAKDPRAAHHGEQVAHYAVNLATYAETPDDMVESIRIAAVLHDIGKIGAPDDVLTKPRPLTEEHLAHIGRHPALGAEILENVSILATEARLVRHHHENWDGTGYPDGLAGREIPFGSRVIHVVDSIDNILMERTNKGAYSVERMLGELAGRAGRRFDPVLAAAAAEWCRNHPNRLILPAGRAA